MTETWEGVPGWEDQYQVSDMGRIRSLDRVVVRRNGRPHTHKGRIRKFGKSGDYLTIAFESFDYTETWFVSVLVATVFISNPDNKPQVNHKNGKKWDNKATNLEWCTQQENMDHAKMMGLIFKGSRNVNAKLTESDIPAIRQRIAAGEFLTAIARDYKVNPVQMTYIKHRKTWSHVPSGGPSQ